MGSPRTCCGVAAWIGSEGRVARLAIVLVVVSVQASGVVAQPCLPPPPGLVSWWPCDGDPGELARGLDGNPRNGASFAPGRVGDALRLDGVDDFVEVPDSPLWTLGDGPFTMDLWLNFAARPGRAAFVSHNEGHGERSKWVFWFDPSGHGLPGRGLRFHICGPSLGPIDTVFAPWEPQLGRWYHVAVTRIGATYRLYVDGAEVAEGDDPSTIPNAEVSLLLGQSEDQYFFPGMLDEVEILDRALCEAEIRAIVDAGAAGKCRTSSAYGVVLGDLALWLEADAGVTTDASGRVSEWRDQSGAGHHATQTDAARRAMWFDDALNGQPLLRFDGVDDFYALAGQVLTSQRFSIFAVVNDKGDDGSYREILSNWTGDNTVTSVFFGTTEWDPRRIRLTDDFDAAGIAGTPSTDVLLTGISGATSTAVCLFGDVVASRDTAISQRDLRAPYAIGNQGALAEISEFWNGDIAEILVYDRELSLGECRQNWEYLNHKYFAREYIVDDGDPGTLATGTWSVSGGAEPWDGRSLYSSAAGAEYRWKVPVPEAGSYEVFLWWTSWPSRLPAVPVSIRHAFGTATLPVNQRLGGGLWNSLGVYSFSTDATVTVRSLGGGSTCADAVKLLRTDGPPISPPLEPIIIDDGSSGTSWTGSWPVSGAPNPWGARSLYSKQAGAEYRFETELPEAGSWEVFLWWTSWPSRLSSVPVIIEHAGAITTRHVNQLSGGGTWNSLGVFSFGDDATIRVRSLGVGSTCADAVKLVRVAAPQPPPPPQPVIVDNGTPGTSRTGAWLLSGAPEPWGTDSLYSKEAGATYRFDATLPQAGKYEVFLWWTSYPSRLPAVPVTVRHALGDKVVLVNQLTNGGRWNSVGIHDFTTWGAVTVNSPGGGSTCADAVSFVAR